MDDKIFVSNLPLSITEGQLGELFSEFGAVDRVRLVTASDTGRSRGSGFVAMSSGIDAAIEALDRRPIEGSRLYVRPALPALCNGKLRTPKRARNHRFEEACLLASPALTSC